MHYEYSERDKRNDDWRIRLGAYQVFGFDEVAKEDPIPYVRLGAYKALGYTPSAKKDPSTYIRLKAYRKLGYLDAYIDQNPFVRKWALDQEPAKALNVIRHACKVSEPTRHIEAGEKSRSMNLWRMNY